MNFNQMRSLPIEPDEDYMQFCSQLHSFVSGKNKVRDLLLYKEHKDLFQYRTMTADPEVRAFREARVEYEFLIAKIDFILSRFRQLLESVQAKSVWYVQNAETYADYYAVMSMYNFFGDLKDAIQNFENENGRLYENLGQIKALVEEIINGSLIRSYDWIMPDQQLDSEPGEWKLHIPRADLTRAQSLVYVYTVGLLRWLNFDPPAKFG
jgi:hypothetical protein